MKRFPLLLSLFALSFVFFSFSPVGPNKGAWKHLGSQKVNFGLDHDVIRVGTDEGGLTKLKVLVSGGAVNMHRMVITYGNGSKETVQLKHRFHRGSDSRIIDLKGGKRVIKSISFWYDSVNKPGGRATVRVLGRR